MELVIFDLDGVLFDSGELVVESVALAVERLRRETGRPLPLPSRERIFGLMGTPNREYARGLGLELDETGLKRFKTLVGEAEVEMLRAGHGGPHAGMPELVGWLGSRGVSCAVASNCGRPYLLEFLDRFGLAGEFAISVCNDDCPAGDKTDLLRMVLEHQEVLASEAVYLGDRGRDESSARALGLGFLACTWGFGTDGEFSPDVIRTTSPAEVRTVLARLLDVRSE
jgi:phosphoglycolate phosphatase